MGDNRVNADHFHIADDPRGAQVNATALRVDDSDSS
jgi:hypothetical protein